MVAHRVGTELGLRTLGVAVVALGAAASKVVPETPRGGEADRAAEIEPEPEAEPEREAAAS